MQVSYICTGFGIIHIYISVNEYLFREVFPACNLHIIQHMACLPLKKKINQKNKEYKDPLNYHQEDLAGSHSM